jgi:hypothetical protein
MNNGTFTSKLGLRGFHSPECSDFFVNFIKADSAISIGINIFE